MWGANNFTHIAQKKKNKISLPSPHKSQLPLVDDSSRFKTLCCGRRWGKSVYLQIEAYLELIKRGGRVMYFAPTFAMVLDTWNAMKQTLAPLIEQKSEQEKMLRLKNGGYFKCFSANNAEVIRGGKYHLVLIDEAAIIPDLENTWNNIIRPTLTDYVGSAIFGSTPRGNNFFKTLYDRGQSSDTRYKNYASYHNPSWDNPYLRKSEILESIKDVSERAARQETMAEFLDDAGSVFVGIMNVAKYYLLEPYHSPYLSIGIDLGRKNDYTVLSVYDGERKQIVGLERFNIISWQEQEDRIVDFTNRWGDPEVTIETNNIGDVLYGLLLDRNVKCKPFYTNNENKRLIIEGLAADIQWGRIKLPADPNMISEFQTFESKILESGKIKYGAASGFHDDTVMSIALARHGFENLINMFGSGILRLDFA